MKTSNAHFPVQIPLAPKATIFSMGIRFKAGAISGVVVNDCVVFAATASDFAAKPIETMRNFLNAVVQAVPASAVKDLDKGGKQITFPNKTVLQGWPDCVSVSGPIEPEVAWASSEWDISPMKAELVVGAFLVYLQRSETGKP